MLKERSHKRIDETLSIDVSKKLSLRDPAGALFDINGRLFRTLSSVGWDSFQKTASSLAVKQLEREEKLVTSKILNEREEKELLKTISAHHVLPSFEIVKILEHKKIEFVSYPHEWCSEMLRDAGLLTIEISERLLSSKIGLKDGNPFNIVFNFGKPVFVDVLSLEKRNPNDPLWMAYGQFSKCFINTLLLSHYFKIPFEQSLATNRDGMPIERVYSLLSITQKFTHPFFTAITMPVLLSKFHDASDLSLYKPKNVSEELAEFTLSRLFKKSKNSLLKLKKMQEKTASDKYMQLELPYSKGEFEDKHRIVKNLLHDIHPKKVLDIGANTGHFSTLAAEEGASVVAVDSDFLSLSTLYKNAQKKNLNILPLRMDITCPTPSTGWSNEESYSFMQRFEGKFDTCIMLALIHHLLTTHAIPIDAVAALCNRLTNLNLIIEYISPEDPMFQSLARGRNYSYITQEYFEQVFLRYFSVVTCNSMKNFFRKVYHLKKRRPHA